MQHLSPASAADVPAWARRTGLSLTEARARFVQLLILRAIGGSRSLGPSLVLKGGNALDFVWLPNRSTRDLDFTLDPQEGSADFDESSLRSLLANAIALLGRRGGVELRVQRVRQNPPGPDRRFVTYEATIGYAFEDQQRQLLALREGRPSAQVVPLDISMNEVVCASELRPLGEGTAIRVSTLEDVVAEKLRALLQQPLRNRYRNQDLLDIAVAITRRSDIDRQLVAAFLLRKAGARDVAVSREAFRQAGVRERAQFGYADLRLTARETFIEYEEAMRILLDFVEGLDIPPA